MRSVCIPLLIALLSLSLPIAGFSEESSKAHATTAAEHLPFQPPLHYKQRLSLQDAIKETLTTLPSVHNVILDVDQQLGTTKTAAAPFDVTLSATGARSFVRDNLNFISSQVNSQTSSGSVQATKRFRFGTLLRTNASISRTRYVPAVLDHTSTGTVLFELTQPLLNNLYRGAARMTERASKLDLESTKYNTLHTISQLVNRTVFNYWEAVAAKHTLDVQRNAEERLQSVVNNSRILVRQNQLAESDIHQSLARLANQQLRRVRSQQAYYSALKELFLSMGYAEADFVIDDKALILDSLAAVERNPQSLSQQLEPLVDHAFHHRFDLLAAGVDVAAAAARYKGARNNKLPQLDLVGQASITDTRTLNRQKEYTVGLTFSLPLQNSAARGVASRERTIRMQHKLTKTTLTQTVISNITETWNQQLNLVEQLHFSEQEVKNYEKLLESERRKLAGGVSTLFTTLQFEDQLTDAQLFDVQLLKSFAQNISLLRFYSGTLLKPDVSLEQIEIEEVTTIPQIY